MSCGCDGSGLGREKEKAEKNKKCCAKKKQYNTPKMAKVLDVIPEHSFHNTIILDIEMDAKPGQFVMIWVPGVDEKPMAIMRSGKNLEISVEGRGKCTKMITSVKKGDTLGVRGPYGNCYSTEKNAILVGGGVGMPPIAGLAEQLGENVRVLQGTRSKDRLLFVGKIPNMRISTDDGSEGHKGLVTELLEEEIQKKKPKIIYACGPEMMMVAVAEIGKKHGIEVEVSLERYMRCGMGICGSCVCGKSVICMDGPVYNLKQLEQLTDFGKFALKKSARKVTLKEYYANH